MSIAFPKELFAAVQEVYNFVLAPVEKMFTALVLDTPTNKS